MSANNLMIEGLANSLFADKKDAFEKEKSFGKRLYKTAWAVEILAASIGLLIAWFMAYDAYNSAQEKNFTAVMNAVLGALPFLLIAIIEPTKIPLAGGLYKIKHFGWKALIFIALFGLTCVTFETLFTGLERQVTNVTAKISMGEDEITGLEEINTERKSQKEAFESRSIVDETEGLKTQIEGNLTSQDTITNQATEAHDVEIKQINKLISDAQNRKAEITSLRKADLKDEREPLTASVADLDDQIKQKQTDIQKLEDDLTALKDGSSLEFQEISQDIKKIKSEIVSVQRQLGSGNKDQIKMAQGILGVISDGSNGPNTVSAQKIWVAEKQDRIKALEAEKAEKVNKEESNLEENKETKKEEISQAKNDLTSLKTERKFKQNQITELSSAQAERSSDESEIATLDEKITGYQDKKVTLTNEHIENINKISNEVNGRIESLEAKKTAIEEDANEEIKKVPDLKDQISKTKKDINAKKHELRRMAQQNQIYRFAKWKGKHEDILNVSEEDLRFVAIVWFGSIALVCATVGTILALISYIMTDPAAFVKKQKLIIDNPLRRSTRRLVLALRKKLLVKRKIKEVEVEKIVEVEKEVIKEVEKIVEVEKEVIKEVPVEKIVIQEVPVEIIRRELVHVPFFSTEGGVVDSSEYLRTVSPRLDSSLDQPADQNKTSMKNRKTDQDDQS